MWAEMQIQAFISIITIIHSSNNNTRNKLIAPCIEEMQLKELYIKKILVLPSASHKSQRKHIKSLENNKE